jgi:hypothetical protein
VTDFRKAEWRSNRKNIVDLISALSSPSTLRDATKEKVNSCNHGNIDLQKIFVQKFAP